MNKFAVVLSSIVDGATVSVQILVESEMSASQLATFYRCKSITISDVYVEALDTPLTGTRELSNPLNLPYNTLIHTKELCSSPSN